MRFIYALSAVIGALAAYGLTMVFTDLREIFRSLRKLKQSNCTQKHPTG